MDIELKRELVKYLKNKVNNRYNEYVEDLDYSDIMNTSEMLELAYGEVISDLKDELREEVE